MRRVTAATVLIVALAASCSSATVGTTTPKTSATKPTSPTTTKVEPAPTTEPPPPTTTTTAPEEESVEFKIAALDGIIAAGNADPVLAPYVAALDALEPKCTNDRTLLGDFAVTGRDLLADRGETITLLEFLHAIDESLPPGLGPIDCAEIAAAVVTLAGA